VIAFCGRADLVDKIGWVIGAAGMLLLGMSGTAAPVPAPAKPAPIKPALMIAEQGNFYVGGQRTTLPEGTVVADAMYVEFQIPAKQTHPYPLVFLHGAASHGAAFWSTPDGREGWATQFLRKGYAVYVVDRPTQGRSPYYSEVDGPKLVPPTALPIRAGAEAPPKVKPATRVPGAAKPDDPATEQSARARQSAIEIPLADPAEALRISARVDQIDRMAGAALLARIGPAVLVTYSRSGVTGWQIADASPGLVKAIVAAEPNGPPFYNVPPMWLAGDPVSRPWGIAYGPLTFDPPVRQIADFGVLTRQVPANADLIGCWVPSVPHRLVNLVDVPVLVVSGGASYHAAYDQCTVQFLRDSAVPVTAMRLGDMGIEGNTHGLIVETNNDVIADRIAGWLAERHL
jgi:pimeloyl-ACP methyl ester carboxylesterase